MSNFKFYIFNKFNIVFLFSVCCLISHISFVIAQSPCPNLFKCGDTLVDARDGNKYITLQLGTQCWFGQELYETKYLNGDLIPQITDQTTWNNLITGAWSDQNNDPANGVIYGHLYNWYAAIDNRNLCPVGWYVPSFNEWTILVNYLGGPYAAGISMGGGTWVRGGGNNSSGFKALPGGYRNDVGFTYLGYAVVYWSTTNYDNANAYKVSIDYANSPTLALGNGFTKFWGCSVRCVRDY